MNREYTPNKPKGSCQ